MKLWTLNCFFSKSGRDLIDDWYGKLPLKARVKFDTRIEYLQSTPRQGWIRPYFDALKNSEGICEIRFEADNVQHRVLGFFGPDRNQFTALLGAIEKGNKFIPRDAAIIAIDRKDLVMRDRSRIHECKF